MRKQVLKVRSLAMVVPRMKVVLVSAAFTDQWLPTRKGQRSNKAN